VTFYVINISQFILQYFDFGCFLALLWKTFAIYKSLATIFEKVMESEHNRLPFIKLALSGNSSMELDLLDLLGSVDPGDWEFAQFAMLVSPFSRILTKVASLTQEGICGSAAADSHRR
jgi:hypothetical protein